MNFPNNFRRELNTQRTLFAATVFIARFYHFRNESVVSRQKKYPSPVVIATQMEKFRHRIARKKD